MKGNLMLLGLVGGIILILKNRKMVTSKEGKEFITRREGIVKQDGTIVHELNVLDSYVPYKDSLGLWTHGIGHWLRPDEQDMQFKTLSGYEVKLLFDQDIRDAEKAVDKRLKRKVSQHEYDALVSFAFNVNQHKDNLSRASLFDVINQKVTTEALIEDKLLLWPNKVRRKQEADLFNYAQYV